MPNINAQSKKHLIPLFNLFPKTASISVTFVGFVVLIGWIFNIPTLKSISPGLVTMKANTAVAFILAGISLWILCKQKIGERVRFIAKSCATIVALIGLLTLTEYIYIFGWELGIDQLLFRESAEVVGTSHPGRMAPTTALNFFLLGSALILLDMPFGFQPSQFFAILGSFIILRNSNSLNEVDNKRKKAEEALQKSHDELEIRVQERTSELSKR